MSDDSDRVAETSRARVLVERFARFLMAAASIGIVSMLVLEGIEWAFALQSPTAHAILVTAIYLPGVVVNFQLQRRWVFATSGRASFIAYALWMALSASVVGALSGVIFRLLHDQFGDLPLIPSMSMIAALAICSPLTFLGVAVIMRRRHA